MRGGKAGNFDEGHHRDRIMNRSNEWTKTRRKAETKYTDTNDETRNR